MGQLVYFVNHTIREYFCPYASKWGEILLNQSTMEDIFDFIRDHWNNCKIEIVMQNSIDKIDTTIYKYSERWESIERGYRKKIKNEMN